MVESWAGVWAPDHFDPSSACDAWSRLADEAALPNRDPPGPPASFLPSRQHFAQAMSNCSGSAGFDGWTSHELHALEKHLTFLSDELYELWCKTTLAALNEHELRPDLANLLWTWRVVGVPKRNPFDSRPVSVGSCLLRVWRKALLGLCPGPLQDSGTLQSSMLPLTIWRLCPLRSRKPISARRLTALRLNLQRFPLII